jgi:DNA polymerase elongation subunit (family B)
MIKDLKDKDNLRETHFLVRKVDKKVTKTGKDYYDLELSDNSGVCTGKIWENTMFNCKFEKGKVIEVNGIAQEYQGKIGIVINSCEIVNNSEVENFKAKVPTLVFDLETIGKDFSKLDEGEQDYLINNLERNTEDKEEAKGKTGLYSIFGTICAAGGYDSNSNKGFALVLGKGELIPENENFKYYVFENEKDLLIKFWEITASYEKFVTYNGEGFDFPYLVIRSGINRVKMPFEVKKYGNSNHIDLMNKLSQNRRGFKLEFMCKAFGVKNPKAEGVHGGDVAKLYKAKEYNKIADYVSRDVVATDSLYKIWQEYLSGEV